MALIEPVRRAFRAAAERRLARDYPSAERAMNLSFRAPSGFPLRAVAALELAGVLGERFPERPIRLRRLIAAARATGGRPYAVVGDSHSTHLVREDRQGWRWLLPIHRLCTGASARGLANAEASAQAGAKVRGFLEHLATAPMPVVFKFGQVDLEFVFTFKRLEGAGQAFDETAFDAFAEETVARYLGFLVEATPEPLRPLALVAGVFPPALSDSAWRQGYVNAHIADLHGPADPAALDRLASLEIPSLAVRTRLHARFNARLFEAARAAGFRTLDGFETLLGADGTLHRGFLGRAGGANHHLGYAASRAPMTRLAWMAAETAQSNR